MISTCPHFSRVPLQLRSAIGRCAAAGLLGLMGVCMGAPLLRAVDQSATEQVEVGGRWEIIGIISEGARLGAKGRTIQGPKAVVVLRNRLSRKSVTLSLGDPLPYEDGYVLSAVTGRGVVVSGMGGDVTLRFAEEEVAPPRETVAEGSGRSNRFLDAYYRGLADSTLTGGYGFDSLGGDSGDGDSHEAVDLMTSVPAMPPLRGLHEDRQVRLEVFRPHGPSADPSSAVDSQNADTSADRTGTDDERMSDGDPEGGKANPVAEGTAYPYGALITPVELPPAPDDGIVEGP